MTSYPRSHAASARMERKGRCKAHVVVQNVNARSQLFRRIVHAELAPVCEGTEEPVYGFAGGRPAFCPRFF